MYNGCTPLHLAVGRKDAAVAAILSHSGADTLLRNMEDETAQDLADGNDDVSLPVSSAGQPVVGPQEAGPGPRERVQEMAHLCTGGTVRAGTFVVRSSQLLQWQLFLAGEEKEGWL